MRITLDSARRDWTLRKRGIDFADAVEVFAGPVYEKPDNRRDYGETRIVTAGFLRGRMVVVVWTQRGDARRIISMRKANDREKARFGKQFEEDR
jgi:hypothetical protein